MPSIRRRGRRGGGTQRADRRRRTGPPRLLRGGLRGAGHRRRRRPHRGADAARLPPRPVLGRAPARASARPPSTAMPLERYGLEWLHPELPHGAPLPGRHGRRAVPLGRRDGRARSGRATPARTAGWSRRSSASGTPSPRTSCRSPLHGAAPRPGHPRPLRAGRGCQPVDLAQRAASATRRPAALFAGLAAHVIAPLERRSPPAASALVFALAAHANGWPVAARRLPGRSPTPSPRICATRAARSTPAPRSSGWTSCRPPARTSSTPRRPRSPGSPGSGSAYEQLPLRRRASSRSTTRWTAPCPWTAEEARARRHRPRRPDRRRDRRGPARAPSPAARPTRPFLITAQPSLVDPSRAPEGKHVFWAYGHVPNGWEGDATDAIERQLERFAPGFRDLVLARATAGPARTRRPQRQLRRRRHRLRRRRRAAAAAPPQARPRPRTRTAHPAVFLCSSATPPGPGVHGMSGHHAAKAVWRRLRQEP